MILIISGAYSSAIAIQGNENSKRQSNYFVVNTLNSFIEPFESNEDILGNITPVNAVNTDIRRVYSLTETE